MEDLLSDCLSNSPWLLEKDGKFIFSLTWYSSILGCLVDETKMISFNSCDLQISI